MTIFITHISPKPTEQEITENPVAAHLRISDFRWVDEQNTRSGVASRATMFDWIVNKQGKAFVNKPDGTKVPVFGVNSSLGQYIRTVEEGQWTNLLAEKDVIPPTPVR